MIYSVGSEAHTIIQNNSKNINVYWRSEQRVRDVSIYYANLEKIVYVLCSINSQK